MITTTGSARQKMCPLDRGQNYARQELGGMTGACVGPDCMMWRFWVPPPGSGPLGAEDKPRKHGQRDTDKLGFCGLSGAY